MGTFSTTGNYASSASIGGKTVNIDPRIVTIMQNAAAASPYNVVAFSGVQGRASGTTNHPGGFAMDIYLQDPSTGQLLTNYGGNAFKQSGSYQENYPAYEQFAQTARVVQQQMYPELNNTFRWGGYFDAGNGNQSGPDLMHFDDNPAMGGAESAGNTWDRGATSAFQSRYGITSNGGLKANPTLVSSVSSWLKDNPTGLMPPNNVPAVASAYADSSDTLPLPRDDPRAAQAAINSAFPAGSSWSDFYKGILPENQQSATPTQIASAGDASQFYSGLGLPSQNTLTEAQRNAILAVPTTPQDLGTSLAFNPVMAPNATPALGSSNANYPMMGALYPQGATENSGAIPLSSLVAPNSSGSPDDRDTPLHQILSQAATGNTVQSPAGPGYNQLTPEQRNAIAALPAAPNAGGIDPALLAALNAIPAQRTGQSLPDVPMTSSDSPYTVTRNGVPQPQSTMVNGAIANALNGIPDSGFQGPANALSGIANWLVPPPSAQPAPTQTTTPLAPGYNAVNEAQRNALLAVPSLNFGASMSPNDAAAFYSSLGVGTPKPNTSNYQSGNVPTTSGIAGTVQMPAGARPSLNTGTSTASDNSWQQLIDSFSVPTGGGSSGGSSVGPSSGSSTMAMNNYLGAKNFMPGADLTSLGASVPQNLVPQYITISKQVYVPNQIEQAGPGVISGYDENGLPQYSLAAPSKPTYRAVTQQVRVPNPAYVAPPVVQQPIASTNGYLYKPNGNGGYTNVGSANPGLTPSQQYALAAAPALNSQPNGGYQPANAGHTGGSSMSTMAAM